jgi:photosystem II stability/assembly factor-like uncharacterized protein
LNFNAFKWDDQMKKLFQVLSFIVLSSQICTAQWIPQSSGTTKNLLSVYFINSTTGWTVGRDETILKTIDGGNNWISQFFGLSINYESVYFSDSNTGWIVGSYGSILKSTDGGNNWTSQNSGTTLDLKSVYFIDSN